MNDVTAKNFGLAIAYLIPGFVALGGVAAVSDVVRVWLGGSAGSGPTVGGFLYVTLGSVATGMTVSAPAVGHRGHDPPLHGSAASALE